MVMPRRVLVLVALVLLITVTPTRADVITDWNETAVITTAGTGMISTTQSRALAIVHAAMHDAVSAVERRYAPYAADLKAPVGASRDAAVVAAAHTVLTRLLWPQTPIFDAALEASLAAIPDGAPRRDGIAAAERILAARANDGAGGTLAYAHRTGPGMYQATPPVNAPPVMPHWASVRPFTLKSPDQIVVKGPTPYDSPEFARDFAEVKLMGAKNSTARTREQTEAARFWLISGVVTDNAAARQVAIRKGTSVAENARAFALLNMAGADAYIACWEAKYRLHHWRPITAIRNAGALNNPALVADPNWESLLVTPAHPEYPSGHTCYAGATERVSQEMWGDNNSFTIAFPAMRLTRTYQSFSQLGKR